MSFSWLMQVYAEHLALFQLRKNLNKDLKEDEKARERVL